MLTRDCAHALFVDHCREVACLREITAETPQHPGPFFLGRFLTDLSVAEIAPLLLDFPGMVLRQYGGSCYMNAQPPLADAFRAELGLEEAEDALRGGKYRVIILSQILSAVHAGLLRPQDVATIVEARPPCVSLILTGSDVSAEMIESLGDRDRLSLQIVKTR
jgi:hypothetical protein